MPPAQVRLFPRQRGWVIWLLHPVGWAPPNPPTGLGAGWSTALAVAASLDPAQAADEADRARRKRQIADLIRLHGTGPPPVGRDTVSVTRGGAGAPGGTSDTQPVTGALPEGVSDAPVA